LTKSDDPEIRLRALSHLHDTGQADESTLLSAFRVALADEDSSVKSYAIEALAIQPGPDATGYLGRALRDPDPSIRILAIENIAQQGHDPALLQEALSDKDERVRSLAAFWLKKGSSEGR
jgi:HEAT repeat protein